MASGSEVSLALAVAEELSASGVGVRVVSMPCMELFENQDDDYKASVLPKQPDIRRISIEMSHPQSWYKYLGLDDVAIGIKNFGASGPADKIISEFGFTKEHVLEVAKGLLNK